MSKIKRRKTAVLAIIAAVILILVAFLVPAAGANNAAVVIDPAGPCLLFDGDGNLVPTTNTMIVITQSRNGNAHLKCQGDVPNNTGRAVHFDANDNPISDDLTCNISGVGATLKWHNVVSADGKSTVTCHYKD